MGTSQFAFVRMPPGKWASSDSLTRVAASGIPMGAILGQSEVTLNVTIAVSERQDPAFLRFAPRWNGR